MKKSILALTLSMLLALIAPGPSFVFANSAEIEEAHLLSPVDYLNDDGTLNITDDLSGSFDISGYEVVLDATRGPVVSRSNKPVAASLGAWSSLGGAGTGLSAGVYTVAVDNGVIYAGGDFTDAGGDADADRIAKFSGGAWSSLGGAGTGLGGQVTVILIDNGVIYAGGAFSNAGGESDADHIAKFSGGAWSSLGGAGTGLNARVYSLMIDNGVIYAGGDFTDAGGDTDADRIAQFSGGAWSSLGGAGTGLSNSVNDIVIDGSVIYAGGNFLDAGGDADADRIAKYSGGSWSSLGGVGSGLSGIVYQVAVENGAVYAGGFFSDAGGDADADNLAKFSGGGWSSLGGVGTGLSSGVVGFVFDGDVLYAAGLFSNAGGDADADGIAEFSSGAWSSLGGAGTGLISYARKIAIDSGVLYTGGNFTDAGGDGDADYIAQYGLYTVTTTTTSESSDTAMSSVSAHRTSVSESGGSFASGKTLVILPQDFIPAGYDNCRIAWTEVEDNNVNVGFTTGDKIYDISIVCNPLALSTLAQPITICLIPDNGITSGKQVFHQHGGGAYTALPLVSGPSGYVCGSTSQLSNFTLDKLSLPNTGFAPGEVAYVAQQPQEKAYSSTSLMLEIPKLDLEIPIVGVPMSTNSWDTTWLGAQAGYLESTAFPTLAGNTVLTAHVWDANNTPGPFAHLRDLQHGDRFSIHAWGLEYVYEVRSSRLVSGGNLTVFNETKLDWVTLLTCEGYQEGSDSYLYRRAVQAVLISVE